MKLLSVKVQNYRLHRDLHIEFDGSRTLIGGPNETGKSTLIEAIHRGFFLKSRGTSAMHKAMVSTLHSGHPEVEICFNAGNGEFTLRKRFSGQNGTTQLIQAGGETWQGDDAEERLAQFLGNEDAGGRTTASKINEQWAHLWVWQGMSGDDPSEHAASQQDHLLQQLQDSGGSVAMQSELDGKVASRFAQARDAIFVRAGNAKVGSDLDRAQNEQKQAEAEQATAAERFSRLQQAINDFETAEATILRSTTDLTELRQQQEALSTKISQTDELQRTEKEQITATEVAVEKLTTLDAVEVNISSLRESIGKIQESLNPKQEQKEQAEARLTDTRSRANDSERAHDEASTKTRDARLRRELAAAYITLHEKEARTKELQKRLERVQALENEMVGFRDQLAQLPTVDQDGLDALRGLENELAQASAALNAMAAEIEVIAADQSVRIGEDELTAGNSRTVSETTDVKVGDTLCLRIHPGGGDSLSNAREQARTLHEQLQLSLDECGLESIAKVSTVVVARADLHAKLDTANAALEELDADELAESCADAKDEFTTAQAEVNRRLEQVSDVEAPAALSDAKAWQDKVDAALQDAESNETGLKATRDTLQQQVADLDLELRTLVDAITEDRQALTGYEAQLNLLTENHGDDEVREKTLEDARKTKRDAEEALARTRKALDTLQPDLLDADRQRLERALSEANRQQQEAQTTKAVSQSTLRSDGANDPIAALAQANAQFASSQEHLDAVSRKAKAIELINELFQLEQRALADRFSQPLANKISGYLQTLFGSDAEAVVAFEDNALTGIQLVRSAQGGAMSFENLSGGTCEQVAAAVRLAIAELLAADHNGSLPVVFDDAFAYSDPERVHVLQRMLDLGATRGLQIIVLTCNPSDYAALGARHIILSPETTQVDRDTEKEINHESHEGTLK